MSSNKNKNVDKILDSGVITIVRTQNTIDIFQAIKAIAAGGLPIIEVTSNTPSYLEIIREVHENLPEVLIGAGTITTVIQAQEAIKSGAQYLVTPITSKSIVEIAQKNEIPVVMGAFSPTEIHNAIQYGADFIKLFPAEYLSPQYLKAVNTTCTNARFIPTGGINVGNMKEWMQAGAVALGIGSSVVNQKMIAEKDFQGIEELARKFKSEMQNYRKPIE